MATIVTRSGKGSPLTHAEVDSNFTNLNTDKLELSGGTMTGNLSFGDNDKAIFGAGSDLEIYSDGTTGQIVGDVNITGTLTSDGLTVDGNGAFSGADTYLAFIETDLTNESTRLRQTSGSLYIQKANNSGGFIQNMAQFDTNGDISFYEDTGTTAKFFWDASAESLGIGTTSPTYTLDVETNNDGGLISSFVNTASSIPQGVLIDFPNATPNATNRYFLQMEDSTSVKARIDTTGGGYFMGNVGIGTSSPAVLLDVAGDGTAIVRTRNTNSTLTTDTLIGGYEFFKTDGSGSGAGVVGAVRMRSADGVGSSTYLTLSTSAGGVANDVERMRIDSSGNVTIKANNASGGGVLNLENTETAVNGQDWGSVNFISNDSSSGASGTRASIVGTSTSFNGDGNLVFSTAPSNGSNTERMRIDSSGNFLVGTTNPNMYQASAGSTADNGFVYGVNDFGTFSRYANDPLILNRTGTDGGILQFRKDGSTVGSIGTRGGNVRIGNGDVGLEFHAGDNAIYPANITANSLPDGTLSLGLSSYRFKDLYLSGGVYLGGTGSANKLDDYEEGTFTPVIYGTTTSGTGTYTLQLGSYIKVGNLVNVQIYLGWSAHTGTGDMRMSGLPFNTEDHNTYGYSTPTVSYVSGLTFTRTQVGGYLAGNTDILVFSQFDSGILSGVPMDSAVSEIMINATYRST